MMIDNSNSSEDEHEEEDDDNKSSLEAFSESIDDQITGGKGDDSED